MRESSFIDRPAARLVALAVVLLVILSLGVIHRDDLFPPDAADIAVDDPIARCLAERAAEIDRMVEDEVIDTGQAELFKSRAGALCVAQQNKSSLQ